MPRHRARLSPIVNRPHRWLALLPLIATAALPLSAADQAEDDAESKRGGGFFSSLLPKSLQKNPRLDLNVITEMTAEGRKLARPTAAKPAYYLTHPGGFLKVGQASSAGEQTPPVADLERVMQKALARSHYLSADGAGQRPTLAIIYHWGAHNNLAEEGQAVVDRLAATEAAIEAGQIPPSDGGAIFAIDQLQFALTDLAKRKDLLERAALVGGTKFAQGLGKAIEEQVRYVNALGPQVRLPPGGNPIMGDLQGMISDSGNPFERFIRSNPQVEHLVEESFSTCYFVIASAYDAAEMTQGRRKLLWRTKMTVNADGVALKETLPTLVITAGQYFGRDMDGAATVSRRLLREGQVEIGTPTVVEYPSAPPPPAPAKR